MQQSRDVAALELSARKAWTLARLGEVINRGRSEGWVAGAPMEAIADSALLLERASAAGTSPMRVLAERLELSASEVDALWLLSCMELDPMLSGAAQALFAPGMHGLSAQTIGLLVGGHTPFGRAELERLARHALVETTIDPRTPAYRRPVRVNDRVVELASDRFAVDPELRGIAVVQPIDASDRDSVDVPSALVSAATRDDVLVVAVGSAGNEGAALLRRAIRARADRVLTIECTKLATDPDSLGRQLRAAARECTLHAACLLLVDAGDLDGVRGEALAELIHSARGPVFATARVARAWTVTRSVVIIPISSMTQDLRADTWTAALPGADASMVRACAARYSISASMIERAASSALVIAGATDPTVEHVHLALRGELESRLTGLARRIETMQTWDDLVLPPDQFELLIELVARVKHRHHVLDTWGFADKVGRGLGLAALMSGPPGTGKTMIAGLLARELGLDLYQVDLSKVVSKFIGETEKQLAVLFEAAESGHAILVFDEADSLFGKRTEVKSSNDRYANLEVNYLLQRIESFSGICLPTTNHESAIDEAFQRRLAFHIRVPMPDEAQRELLWGAMLPERAQLARDIDTRCLAREFVMTGGYIKNSALRAAYMAAEEGGPIAHSHLLRAARREYESMGKLAFSAPT